MHAPLDKHSMQRASQNARTAEMYRDAKANGRCRCGQKARTGKVQCADCAEKSKERYAVSKGEKPTGNRYKNPRTKLTSGIQRRENMDGYGRKAIWWHANASINGKKFARKWSVSKHGEDGARLLASLQRMTWIIEEGVWNPEEGDPLALLSYVDGFSGNADYEDCAVEQESSPWIYEYDDTNR